MSPILVPRSLPHTLRLIAVGAMLCLAMTTNSWADHHNYPSFGFGPTPSGGTITFTPGIGNPAIVSNAPVMQIFALPPHGPFANFLTVTGACGGGGCLNVQTGGDTGTRVVNGGYLLAPGGSFTLTGTVGSFTGIIFQGSFTSNVFYDPPTGVGGPFLATFSNLTVNPAVLTALGISNAHTFRNFVGPYFYLGPLSFEGGTYNASILSGGGGGFATPEPGSMVLVGTGLLGIIGAARRRLRS